MPVRHNAVLRVAGYKNETPFGGGGNGVVGTVGLDDAGRRQLHWRHAGDGCVSYPWRYVVDVVEIHIAVSGELVEQHLHEGGAAFGVGGHIDVVVSLAEFEFIVEPPQVIKCFFSLGLPVLKSTDGEFYKVVYKFCHSINDGVGLKRLQMFQYILC